jgi:peptide/nickel transport system permease protein
MARSEDLFGMSDAPVLVAAQAPVRQTRIQLLELGRTHPRVTVGAAFVALLFLVALLAPFLSPHNPIAVNADNGYLRPLSPGHMLGTDELGRDLWSGPLCCR